jgi:hypothetical protein
MTDKGDYYVYVYIDPRNYEEFYYGKGKGNRKDAHLIDGSDSEKAKRIKDIQKAGLKPIIRVIVKDLTEKEAFLIEKTLIWKLGRTLTNKSTGHFAEKFRPQNTIYRELQGFDYKNDVYYINVGEGPTRHWEDGKKYEFMSAGGGRVYSDPLRKLEPGDIVVAYLKGHGFVGIGIVKEKAVTVDKFLHKGQTLTNIKLSQPGMFKRLGDDDMVEYLVRVKWIKAFDREQAKWKKNGGLFTSQLIRASLQGQPKTIEYLEKEFEIKFSDLLTK